MPSPVVFGMNTKQQFSCFYLQSITINRFVNEQKCIIYYKNVSYIWHTYYSRQQASEEDKTYTDAVRCDNMSIVDYTLENTITTYASASIHTQMQE